VVLAAQVKGKMNYVDVLKADEKQWQSAARKLIEKGLEFVVVHVSPGQFNDCKALAQEFDYKNLHEDKSVLEYYPEILPSIIGFAKRDSLRPKPF
jgi:hypothetical protein